MSLPSVPPFSLVSTVFNEMKRLDQTIADLEAQTLKPAEIIITDAGSKDGTYERLLRWQAESSMVIRPLQKLKCNVAEGRNIAIAAAHYPLIASTDFGCRFDPDWLETIMTPFATDESLEVVGGAFTIISQEVTDIAAQADYVLSDAYHLVMDEGFSVSSRSIAYRKHVWEQIGGYPEWLTLAADDTIFWRHVRRLKFKYVFATQPKVYWLRHKTFKGFGKEAFRYGLGDGESTINFRNFVVMTAEAVLRYAWLLFTIMLPLHVLLFGPIAVLPTLLCAPGLRPYLRAWRLWRKHGKRWGSDVLFACFYMIEVTRLYYIRGYLKGWLMGTPTQKAEAKKLRELIA